jgi:hypothetical protein
MFSAYPKREILVATNHIGEGVGRKDLSRAAILEIPRWHLCTSVVVFYIRRVKNTTVIRMKIVSNP